MLYNNFRIMAHCNLTFFLSPTPYLRYEHLKISLILPSGCDKDEKFQPALIFWDIGMHLYFPIRFLCLFVKIIEKVFAQVLFVLIFRRVLEVFFKRHYHYAFFLQKLSNGYMLMKAVLIF